MSLDCVHVVSSMSTAAAKSVGLSHQSADVSANVEIPSLVVVQSMCSADLGT